jgi:hypothetical protein
VQADALSGFQVLKMEWSLSTSTVNGLFSSFEPCTMDIFGRISNTCCPDSALLKIAGSSGKGVLNVQADALSGFQVLKMGWSLSTSTVNRLFSTFEPCTMDIFGQISTTCCPDSALLKIAGSSGTGRIRHAMDRGSSPSFPSIQPDSQVPS